MKIATISASVTLASFLALAQEFEAVSVKPTGPAGPGRGMRGDPGRMNMTGMTLNFLIQQAYDVRQYQISGGSGWVNSDRYDIVAKLPDNDGNRVLPPDPANFTDDQREAWLRRRQAMLQALLADRFQLKVHRETKELSRFVLTVAKGGPKLKKNDSLVEASNIGHGMINMDRGFLLGSQIPISDLILALSQIMGRTIVDRTLLNRKYDFELKWTPDQGSAGLSGVGLPPLGADAPPRDPEGPTIFTALQEQLGLKLDSGKGPVEIIVIDHAEKPSAN
ncbi:MAG: TIGR03435 family protein [Bryobacteraceae bacterium]